MTDLSVLIGQVCSKVYESNDTIQFETLAGKKYQLCHHQDCCESVYVEDIAGDLNDLVGSPLVMAEEATNEGEYLGPKSDYDESHTWTFYKFATAKGYVTIRFYGSSNGYYSESVTFEEVQ